MTLFAYWELKYLTLYDSVSSTAYTLDNKLLSTKRFMSWQNTTGKTMNVTITIKIKLHDPNGSDANSTVAVNAVPEYYENMLFLVSGKWNEWVEDSITIDIPNNYYLCCMNENNANTYWTISVN